VLVEPFYKTISEGRHKDIHYIYGNTSEEFGCNPTQGKIMLDDAVEFAGIQESLGRKKVYLYCFSRRVPGGDNATAAHTAELVYEFGTLSRSWRPYNGIDYQLSINLIQYWSNFIKYGNPNSGALPEWQPFTKSDPKCIELNSSIEMVRLVPSL
jgi:para-nitrobenzyl esterase